MKLVTSLTLLLILTGSVRGELANRIDPTKKADVSGKLYRAGQAETKTLRPPAYRTGRAPLTRATIQHPPLTHERLRQETLLHRPLDLETRPTAIHATTNYRPKRSAQAPELKTLPRMTVGRPAAPITDRVIDATTDEGREELRQQLNLRGRMPRETNTN